MAEHAMHLEGFYTDLLTSLPESRFHESLPRLHAAARQAEI
jgi:hypothetical protein